VFPGGWIWVLRFNNGIVSAGAALTESLATRLGAADGAPAWARLLQELPSVAAQFDAAEALFPFVHARRLAFRSGDIVGHKWALLPSAAGIIDPLLSTGFPLTLLGLNRLLEILECTVAGPERTAALREYARVTIEELNVTEMLVAAMYANMDQPLVFKRLGLLYFAAASFSEAARRLGKRDLAPGFLLRVHPQFSQQFRDCATLALGAPRGTAATELLDRIDRAIAPFDIARFGDGTRRDWFPVPLGRPVRERAQAGINPRGCSADARELRFRRRTWIRECRPGRDCRFDQECGGAHQP
jgi:FADH2 O2-dependent halogenase